MISAIDTMSARRIDKSNVADDKVPALLVSADSHVDEPFDLWDGLPAEILAKLPKRRPLKNRPAGGMDVVKRIPDMDLDGIAAEVLYPSHSMRFFDQDQQVQEAVFPVYNDWIADYCRAAPDRLFGITCLPVYDIDFAIREMRRGRDMGLVGAMIWREPHPDLPYTHPTHYEKLWAAAAEMGQPINLHTLTGFNYRMNLANLQGIDYARGSVVHKTADAMAVMFDLIWSGVCDRHPKIRFEFVEAEIGWIPFVLQQSDYYFHRHGNPDAQTYQQFAIKRLPSEIFAEHFYATFMDDFVGSQALSYWGEKNCLWSSDYPHPNMTWPNSRAFIAKNIGDLPMEKKTRLLSQKVIELYGLKL